MLNYTIKTIPHQTQRYNTVGDYETKEDQTEIRVSDFDNADMEFLVAIHELVESYLCQRSGITDTMIDEFDFAYEAERTDPNAPGPGDNPAAPYHDQHMIATAIENMLAKELQIDWSQYEKKIAAATDSYKQQ